MTTEPLYTKSNKLFVKVPVDYYDDPRYDAAVTEYAGAGDMLHRLTAYSRQNLTDGVVPSTAARRISAPLDCAAALAALTSAGLITHDEGARTYTVVTYADDQQTTDEIAVGRRLNAGHVAAFRARKTASKPDVRADMADVSPYISDVRSCNPMSAPVEVEVEGEGEVEVEESESENACASASARPGTRNATATATHLPADEDWWTGPAAGYTGARTGNSNGKNKGAENGTSSTVVLALVEEWAGLRNDKGLGTSAVDRHTAAEYVSGALNTGTSTVVVAGALRDVARSGMALSPRAFAVGLEKAASGRVTGETGRLVDRPRSWAGCDQPL